jgi:hypothetical protein
MQQLNVLVVNNKVIQASKSKPEIKKLKDLAFKLEYDKIKQTYCIEDFESFKERMSKDIYIVENVPLIDKGEKDYMFKYVYNLKDFKLISKNKIIRYNTSLYNIYLENANLNGKYIFDYLIEAPKYNAIAIEVLSDDPEYILNIIKKFLNELKENKLIKIDIDYKIPENIEV